jgi:DNA repair exonuclease SbcCD ATPase subunit
MLVFKTVRWKNLLATGNNFSEVVLNSHPTTILLGESGSGKSTMLDAISFALYNKPFRNINKSQIVNSINGKNGLVEIEFAIGNKHYLIRRGVKPSIFEIFCNGNLVNQDSHIKDYQQYLEKQILKFNFKAFCQIVVLGASNFTPFMQLKPVDRRLIVEGILDIEIFSVMNNLLKQKISNMKISQQENECLIVLSKEKIILHQKYLKEITDDKKEKIQENLTKIENNKNLILEIETNNLNLTLKVDEHKSKLAFKVDVENNITKIRNIENRLNGSVKQLVKEITFYESHNTCPTCQQEIKEDFKLEEITNKTSKIEECSRVLIQVANNLVKLDSKICKAHKIEADIETIQIQIRKNLSDIDAIKHFIKKIAEETLNLKNRVVSSQDTAIDDLNIEIEELNKKKESLSIEKAVYDTAASLLKDSGVKAKIIKQYLPLINKYANQFLSAMNFFITFSIDEEFNESIKHRGRDDLAYANFSEGEKQRIDLALLFTWRKIAKMKNSVNTNLLALDEVFDSYLDTSATENVLQLINSDLFKNTNVFVISHKESISDKFHANIVFTKRKNFSIIDS